jgi:hypothetical protein
MTRSRIAVGLAAATVAALVVPVLAAPVQKHKNVHFTDTATGAAISAKVTVYKIHDSVAGNGAAVQKITQLSATGGTDVTKVYYGNATATSRDTFTLSAPDANGIITITGHGHDVSGTGKLSHITSTYTFTGTYDPKTTITHVKLTGTESY